MKPIEPLIGDNLSIVKMLIGNIHVGESNLSACRMLRAKLTREMWDQMPKPLRRGFYQAIVEQHNLNRQLYSQVMNGKVVSQ